MEYEVVIGLETHAHFLTGSKMFCEHSTKFARPPVATDKWKGTQ